VISMIILCSSYKKPFGIVLSLKTKWYVILGILFLKLNPLLVSLKLDMHKMPAIFVLLFFWIQPLMSQPPAIKVLHTKTEKRLSEIIASSPAVTGLMAVDLTSGETFAFNENQVFPQASAIKVPILIEVYQQAQQKRFNLSDKLTIAPDEAVGGTGVLQYMIGPVSLSIQNLAVLMITQSDNTATNALIKLVGMQAVNKRIKALGLQETKLQRIMMDVKSSAKGVENISTPAEAVKILKMLYSGEIINPEASAEMLGILKKTERSTSRLAAGIPDDVPIAFKPGMLNGVSTEWAVIYLKKRPYAVAVMEKYKTAGKAERAVEQLSEVLYDYFWRIGNATEYGVYAE